MNSSIIIISFGPSQLLSQIALVRQLGRLHDVKGVVSYVAGHQRIKDFDRKICEVFDFAYLGSLEPLREKVRELSTSGSSSVLQTVFLRNLVRRLRAWILSDCLTETVLGCELVISYRANVVADRFLLHALQPRQVLMVSDGFYMTMGNNVKNRVLANFLGAKDFFSAHPKLLYYPEFYSLQDNCGSKRILQQTNLDWCYKRLAESYGGLDAFSGKPIVMIVWQNLYPKFINDKQILFDFYQDILCEEARRSSVHILVKPHPRSNDAEIDELISFCPNELQGRVEVLRDRALLVVPVEVFLSFCHIIRVGGMASTGIWASRNLAGAEVSLYSSKHFPALLQEEIKRFSSTVESPVQYV